MKKIFAVTIIFAMVLTMIAASFSMVYGQAVDQLEFSLQPDKWLTWNDRNNGPLSEAGAYLQGEIVENALKICKKPGVSDSEAVRGVYEQEGYSVQLNLEAASYFYYDLRVESAEVTFAFFADGTEIKLTKNQGNSDFASAGIENEYKGAIDLAALLQEKGVAVSNGIVTISNVVIYVNGAPSQQVILRELAIRAQEQVGEDSFTLPLNPTQWLTWNDRNDGPLSEDGAYLKGSVTDGALVLQKKDGVNDQEAVRGAYSGEDVTLNLSKAQYLYYDMTIKASEFALDMVINGKNVKVTLYNNDNAAGEIDFIQLLQDNGVDTASGTATIEAITMYVNGPAGNPVIVREIIICEKRVVEPTPTPNEPEAESSLNVSLKADQWLTWNDQNDGPLSEKGAYLEGKNKGNALILQKKKGVSPTEAVRGEYVKKNIKVQMNGASYLFYDFEMGNSEFAIAFHIGGKEIKLRMDKDVCDFEKDEASGHYKGKIDFAKLLAANGIDIEQEEFVVTNIVMYLNGAAETPVTLHWFELNNLSSQPEPEVPPVTGDVAFLPISIVLILVAGCIFLVVKRKEFI